MKIALFIEEDYDFTFDLLAELIPRLKKNHDVRGILIFPAKLTRYQGPEIYLKYLEVFGLRVFLKLARISLIKRLTLLGGRISGQRLFASFACMCSHMGVEKMDFKNPNETGVLDWIKGNEIDVILQFAGYILKTPVIRSPKICILNKHAGLLPSNKGVFPIFWALKFDEPIAVTIHKINEEIDGGDIVLQRVYDKNPGWSVFDYYKMIFSETADILEESLKLIERNAQIKIDHAIPPSYRSIPTRNDYLEFRKLGFRFV